MPTATVIIGGRSSRHNAVDFNNADHHRIPCYTGVTELNNDGSSSPDNRNRNNNYRSASPDRVRPTEACFWFVFVRRRRRRRSGSCGLVLRPWRRCLHGPHRHSDARRQSKCRRGSKRVDRNG